MTTTVAPAPTRGPSRAASRLVCAGLLSGFAPLAPAMAAGPVASLCTPAREQTVFECQTERRRVAVCAAPGWSRDKGLLQYRYGTAQRVELRIPGSAYTTAGTAGTSFGTIVLSGGGGAFLRFRSGEHSYTVYSATSASGGDKAGIVVQAAGRQVASLTCKSPGPATDLDIEAFARAGLPRDEQPFDLP